MSSFIPKPPYAVFLTAYMYTCVFNCRSPDTGEGCEDMHLGMRAWKYRKLAVWYTLPQYLDPKLPSPTKYWCPDLKLTEADQREVSQGCALSSQHIDAAQILLHQLPSTKGLQLSVKSENCSFHSVSVPSIHTGGFHWVTTTSVGCQAKLFDSRYTSISSSLQVQFAQI